MLSPTAILGLLRWQSTDEFDVNEVNANSDTLELAVPVTNCTSGTRPVTGLTAGRRIYETDTGKSYVYQNGGWWPTGSYVPYTNSISPTIVTAAVGWNITGGEFAVVNGIGCLYIAASRTGGTIAAVTDGNIANNTVCTINDAKHRPLVPVPALSVSTGFMVQGYALPDGTVGISALPPNVALATGNAISLGLTYLTP